MLAHICIHAYTQPLRILHDRVSKKCVDRNSMMHACMFAKYTTFTTVVIMFHLNLRANCSDDFTNAIYSQNRTHISVVQHV